MAIAYFIPDQSKLLGGAAANNSNSNQHNNTNNGAGNSATTGANVPHQHQHHQHAYNAPPQSASQHSNNFRANITIPLTAYSASSAHTVGCWDLIAQIFCYVLRFYQQSNRRPTVIQISLEISNGPATPTSATQQPPASVATTRPSANSATPTALQSDARRAPNVPKRN